MNYLKKVWGYGEERRGQFVLLTVVLYMGLYVGLNIAFYYLNKNVESITLTPRSINKFIPLIAISAVYLSLNLMGLIRWFKGADNGAINAIGSTGNVIVRVIKFIMSIVFAPVIWVFRLNKKMKENEKREKARVREYYSDIAKIRKANAILAEDIIKEHNEKKDKK